MKENFIERYNLEEKFAAIDPKTYYPLRTIDSFREANISRGVKKFAQEFAGTKFLPKIVGAFIHRTEKEVEQIIRKLEMIKKDESPIEIINALCSKTFSYETGIFQDINNFGLRKGNNRIGETIYTLYDVPIY